MSPMIVSTAEYLEQSARPAHAPVPSHQAQAERPLEEGRAPTKQATAPSKAASSGPSGNTHVAALMPRTGAAFSTTAAHRPASGRKRSEVTRYIRNVVNEKS